MATKRSNYYLSEEMVFNILSFLPVLSILRFKSVCKTWLSIISNPQFVETQLINSRKKQASVLKACYDWRVYSIDTCEESFGLKLPSHCNGMVRYIRSCNGLVCLSDEYCNVICIWNPCTRQFKMLPVSEKKAELIPLYLGFGFDAIGNDYKILRIAFAEGCSFEAEAELYSANADSWKEVLVPEIEESFWHGPRKICGPDINGVLYLEGDGGLLAFDLHNEVFGEIVLSLWTLDDVCGSWTKKFNLEIDFELNRVFLYLGFEQFVGLNYVFGYKFYDYKKKATKNLPFPTHLTDVKAVVKFTESLVSLEGFQLQE
ncbi:hypothetical protein POM88_026728 [Heracleum sosnowskyi]|uniref:F-box domain-containing protein n=1 Tax=Heracleum sosnowskyi TaxID=360622 RepID=A0AAD8MPI3_9APIA|nr:hypothetical protein POM88_026728 [Heracleum sosnowskyi]